MKALAVICLMALIIPINSQFLTSIIKYKVVQIFQNSNITGECATDLKLFYDELLKLKTWALKMFDASGKLNKGLLHGNYKFFGNFKECLSIMDKVNDRNISGKYCTTIIRPNQNASENIFALVTKSMKFTLTAKQKNEMQKHFMAMLGLCIPKTCSATHLEQLWQQIKISLKIPLEMVFKEDLCLYKNKPLVLDATDFYILYFFGTISIITVLSTVYDLYLFYFNKQPNIFVSFSLYHNMKKILSNSSGNEGLNCLHGIRVLSMIWIIVGHATIIQPFSPLVNKADIFSKWKESYTTSFIVAAPAAVDTFFTMSGMLVVYVYFKYTEKHKVNVLKFYLLRIIRLTPALLATIFAYITLLKFVTEGPIWDLVLNKTSEACRRNPWSTLFYVNNFLGLGKCLPQTWYLSLDSQYYLIAPLILFCFKKYKARAYLFLLAAILTSTLYTAFIVFQGKLGFLIPWELNDDEATAVYRNTFTRIPAWLIGVCFGYLLYKCNKNVIVINKRINVFLWIVSLCTIFGLISYHNIFLNQEYSVVRNVLLNCFSRSLWALTMCWIVYSCSNGYGGCINAFLSHPTFEVLGKLSYSMYLTHVGVMHVLIENRSYSTHFNNFEIFCNSCECFAITLLCSLIWSLLFEFPFGSLMKYALSPPKTIRKVI